MKSNIRTKGLILPEATVALNTYAPNNLEKYIKTHKANG